MSTNI